MILETERLTLRPWCERDAEGLYEYARDPEVGPIAGWPPHKSVEDSLRVIQTALNGAHCFAICLKPDGRAIGAIELMGNGQSRKAEEADACELGYWLGKPFWGNGYMTEAARELIRYGFTQLHMNKIWCGYYEGNSRSKRTQKKCGFVYHHTTANVEVPLLKELRTEHINLLTKAQWAENCGKAVDTL